MSAEAIALRDVVRGKDPLGALCKQRLITSEACDWVKSALDPFHDLQLESLRGYPDVSTEPTVVVKIRQAITVSKPAGLPDGATWDCHIVTSPIDYAPERGTTANGEAICGAFVTPSASFGSASDSAGAVHIGRGTGVNPLDPSFCGRLDGLVINSVPSEGTNGASMTFTPGHMPATPASGYQVDNINLDNYLDYEDTDLGVYRLIYSGFEVVNTTAQIYKQGAVTVYEYGNSYEVGSYHPTEQYAAGGTFNTAFPSPHPANYFRCPPNTIAEAKIMPGSHSWAAADGCYNTAKFQTDNPFQSLTLRPWVVQQNDPTSTSAAGYLPNAAGGYTGGSFVASPYMGRTDVGDSFVGGDNPNRYVAGPAHFSRMNTTGAYFTGLSNESTLFVTWRVGIERLPAANKPMFLALAQPSAQFDPNALVLYNLIANALPPGCPQGYNDAGKWFRWIAEEATKAIPKVYPVVRAAAMMANAAGRPGLGAVLGGVEQILKPKAEAMAAKRLQQAVRSKAARQAPKAATRNWSQPGPKGGRSGGVNGLR